MHSRGVFCFLMVAAFAGMQLSMLHAGVDARGRLAEARAIAMEAERLNAIRAALEVNVDSIVEWELRAGLLQGRGPEEIKERVNGKLLLLFGKVQGAYPGVAEIGFQSGLSAGFLEGNSKVNVIAVGKGVAAEYIFTGGLLKTGEVAAEVRGERTVQEFKIPAGYTVRATVVG